MFKSEEYLELMETEINNLKTVPCELVDQEALSMMSNLNNALKHEPKLLEMQVDALNKYAEYVPGCTIQEARTMSMLFIVSTSDIELVQKLLMAIVQMVQDRIKTYDETIQWLQSKGARICMVTFPLSPIYLNALELQSPLNGQKLRAEMLDTFKSMADHYGATYVDHQKSRTTLSDFRDVDHLNGKAIEAYSKQLHQACFP